MSLSPIVLLHTDKPQAALDKLRERHADLIVHTCDSYSDLGDTLQKSGAEVVYSVRFAGTPHFPRQVLLESSTVKWISVGGSGTDHLQPWDPSLHRVTNAAGVAADMMAEYALGCLLSFRLGLRKFDRAQQKQRWIPGSMKPIEGSSALLIGLGQTGCAVAKRFCAMGMRVTAVRANPVATEHVQEVHSVDTLPELLPAADVVVVAVPLLDSTRDLLSSEAFELLRPDTVLIDVSRGGVVNEAALLNALQQGQLAAAALDVFSEEPLPKGHPFWSMENVIVTPHCSSVYDDWELKSVDMFAENLQRYRHGQPLQRLVDPLRGY